FLGVLLAWQIVPGSDALFVISRGLTNGRLNALWAVLGMTAGAGAVQLPVLIAGRVGCRLKPLNLGASALVQRCLPHLAWHRAAPGEGPGRPDAANQPPGIAVQMA